MNNPKNASCNHSAKSATWILINLNTIQCLPVLHSTLSVRPVFCTLPRKNNFFSVPSVSGIPALIMW
jgi:hypothetical protein